MLSEKALVLDMVVEDVYTTILHFPVSHYISGWNLVNRTWHILVFVKTEDGTIGIGEGTPYWSSVYEDYRETLRLSKMINKQPLDKALTLLKTDESEKFRGNGRVNYGAFLALESALLDASSKISRKAIADLLGGVYRVEIPIAGTVFLKHSSKMAEEIENYIRKGVRHVKFKIPPSLTELEVVLRNIKDVIQRIGVDVVLRADANECFKNFDKAYRALKLMENYNISIVEQPMPRYNLREMSKLRKAFSPTVKIMIDESLKKPDDIEVLSSLEAADVINFHPSKLGCLAITRETMLAAKKQGFEVQIGSALMTEIGLTHYLNLAASLPSLDHPLEEIGLINLYGYSVICNSEKHLIKNGKIQLLYNTQSLQINIDNIKRHQLSKNHYLLQLLLSELKYVTNIIK
ncbi:MAG: mandelate racemase/muconate lactonizing enzyme family protein [Thermosphaera sp.]